MRRHVDSVESCPQTLPFNLAICANRVFHQHDTVNVAVVELSESVRCPEQRDLVIRQDHHRAAQNAWERDQLGMMYKALPKLVWWVLEPLPPQILNVGFI